MKRIVVKKILSDDEIKNKEGEYFDQSHYHTTINEDCDVYTEEGNLLIKFRKNVINKELTDLALKSYKELAKKKHDNRGASAGVLNKELLGSWVGELVEPKKFRTHFKSPKTGKLSKQLTSNMAQSNIIGYYDKPDRNKKNQGPPCRLTAFCRDNGDIWNNSIPFIKRCDEIFKELIPDRHKNQLEQCQRVPKFTIDNTAFSTLTLNYSWRTALHRDKGDLNEGFGNLVVVEDHENPNTYQGGCLGFPQYGVCVNGRTGDFLAMDVHQWHCNTEFIPENDNKDIWNFNRLSIVLYFRKNMVRCENIII